MAAEKLFARIKPYNPKRGFKIRRYSVFGVLFKVERGWYRIENDMAPYLRTVRQDNSDPDSKPAFDVGNEADVKRITDLERRKRIKAGLPVDPVANAADAVSADAKGDPVRGSAEPVGVFESEDDADLAMSGRGDLTSQDVTRPSIASAVLAAEERKRMTVDELPTNDAEDPDPAGPSAGQNDTTVIEPNPADAAPPPEEHATVRVTPDDLTRIDGVGEATEQKLYAAGLETYAQVAEASLATLTELVGGRAKEISKQAKKLAG